RVAEVEYLHVSCAARVADAHWVEEDACVDRALRHLGPDPPQAIAAKRHQVDRVLGWQGVPYSERVSQPGNRTASRRSVLLVSVRIAAPPDRARAGYDPVLRSVIWSGAVPGVGLADRVCSPVPRAHSESPVQNWLSGGSTMTGEPGAERAPRPSTDERA